MPSGPEMDRPILQLVTPPRIWDVSTNTIMSVVPASLVGWPVVAWGCLPPGQTSILPPCQSDHFCNHSIFQDFGHWVWTNPWGVPSSFIPSHSLSSPPGSFCQPFPSLRSGPGVCCKLPQWGLGHSCSKHWVWCILDLKSDIWWQQM